MMQFDAVNWGVAILLSLLVHSMIFMGRGAQMGVADTTVLKQPLITRLSFNKPLDSSVPDVHPPLKKQQPRPVKKIESKPVLSEPVVKKTVINKRDFQRTEPVEKTEPVRKIASLAQVQGQQVSQTSNGLLQRERQQYLHKLLGHIESFKFYPRAARRRFLEGRVKISFMLNDNGYCEQQLFDGEHTVLVKATRQALESAMPLPLPPKDIGLPRQIELAMVYSLTD